MDCTFHKNLFGRYSVKYKCPQCHAALVSRLEEAGQNDVCPTCQHAYAIPGKRKQKQLLLEKKARKLQTQQKLQSIKLQAQVIAKERYDDVRKFYEKRYRDPPSVKNYDETLDSLSIDGSNKFDKETKCVPPDLVGAKQQSSDSEKIGKILIVSCGGFFAAGGILFICFMVFVNSILFNNSNQKTPSQRRRESGTYSRAVQPRAEVRTEIAMAMDWQQASRKDKLYTCEALLKKVSHKLKPAVRNSLNSDEGGILYVLELKSFIDEACAADSNVERNRRMYANQRVSQIASIGIVTMGWF